MMVGGERDEKHTNTHTHTNTHAKAEHRYADIHISS